MRVLVTGAKGMLGTDLCDVLRGAGHEPLPTDVRGEDLAATMDITDLDSTRATLGRLVPDAVIHCAAYTNVDQAEREPDAAYRLNALGSWVVASACAERGVPICAISTDFVFDGTNDAPYVEFDAPNPLGVYGASKLAGETCVRQAAPKHWIVRTSWLYGVHGKNFPDTMIRLAETRPEIAVIADQHGCPTYTRDLAAALTGIISRPLYGTYHAANTGVTTWYDFAREAVRLAGLDADKVKPILAADWPSPTRRPTYSPLRPYALELQGAPLPRPWQEALADFVRERAELHPAKNE